MIAQRTVPNRKRMHRRLAPLLPRAVRVRCRVKRRGDRRVQVQDPKTLGFLAASAKPDHELRLAGAELVTIVCLTGGGPGMGTDLRDVWATSFILPSGDVWVLFSAPDGGILGEVTVPARWTPGRGEIAGEEVARTYASLNVDRT